MMETDLLKFVVDLQNLVSPYQKSVYLHANHYRKGSTFRANTSFYGSTWRDWVMVDWGNDGGMLPNKICGFVDLSSIPADSGITFGGVAELQPGLYAIVENSKYSTSQKEKDMSELFVPIRKVTKPLRHGYVTGMKLYLAEVEAIADTAIVVPDIGGPANAYLLLRNRELWSKMFTDWLDYPNAEDDMQSEEERENEDIIEQDAGTYNDDSGEDSDSDG
jgi:hypothetical protein